MFVHSSGHWSGGNLLAVALGPSVYTWNAETNTVQVGDCQGEGGHAARPSL